MKSELLKQIRKLYLPYKVKRNKKIIIFSFFTVLSFFIWFLIKLDKYYFSTIKLPVSYLNIPRDKILISNIPENFQLLIYGRGFTILRYKVLGLSKINIDLKNYLNNSTSNIITIDTKIFKSDIERWLSTELRLISLEPQNIQFVFSERSQKKVFVIPKIHYQLSNNMILKNVIIEPQSVIIDGPSQYLDTIDTVYTTPISLGTVNQDKSLKLHLEKIPHCSFLPTFIKVNIDLEYKTQKNIEIPINMILNYDAKYRFIPDKIKVQFDVGISQYNSITENSFLLKLKKIDKIDNVQYFKVELENYPENIKNIHIVPEIVSALEL